MAREQTRRFRNVGNAIAAVLSHKNQFGSESLTLEGLASGSSCRLSKHLWSGISLAQCSSLYRLETTSPKKANFTPRNKETKSKLLQKRRLQRSLSNQRSTSHSHPPRACVQFSQKPTFFARMGSSYITPHALFCPGAYSQLSKPYRFGAPTSFYSLLLVSFLSWLHSSGFIRVWSRRVTLPGTSSDDIGSTSSSSSSTYCADTP